MGRVLPDGQQPIPNPSCFADLDYLRRQEYDFTPEIIYQRRVMKATLDDSVDRYEVDNVTQPLVRQGDRLWQSNDCAGWVGQDVSTTKPFEITVPPAFPDRRYPHLLFGVATTYERLVSSKPQFAHWLSRSGSTLVAVVIDAKEAGNKVDDLAIEYRNMGINLVIEHPWNPSVGANEQHFTIVRDLLRHVTPYTEWVAIIDDDTFFPSLYSLSQALNQYDPKLPAYLGGLSESFFAVEHHGVMAYGGAGVFLSVPLIAELDPAIDDCLNEGDVPQGDGLLRRCIYTRTKAKFTMVPGLQQIDLRGDLSGFYESGRLPLSLHHWKSWHDAAVDKMAKVSWFCGGCFLQRWRVGDDTVFTNGYSIAVYENGTAEVPLNEIEGTWDDIGNTEWSLGPLRPAVNTDAKKSYFLVDAEQVGNNLRQIYVHRAREHNHEKKEHTEDCPRDEVIELWWEW